MTQSQLQMQKIMITSSDRLTVYFTFHRAIYVIACVHTRLICVYMIRANETCCQHGKIAVHTNSVVTFPFEI